MFDGGRLPAKEGTCDARRLRKAASLAKGHAALATGDRATAEQLFSQTVDVTPEMAHELVTVLRQRSVEFVSSCLCAAMFSCQQVAPLIHPAA